MAAIDVPASGRRRRPPTTGGARTGTVIPRRALEFRPDQTFRTLLNTRVQESLAARRLRTRDCPALYVKFAVMLLWVAGSYILLVFGDFSAGQALLLAISLGLGVTGLTFNVAHDAGHGAVSRHRVVNQIALSSLDLLGASSYVWVQRHNVIHHRYANIHEYDCDIDQWPLGRLSPHQRHLWFHRFQHIYLWPLYGLYTMQLQFVEDFRAVLSGRLGSLTMHRPTGVELARFLVGKVAFFSLAFALPASRHPVGAVIALYFLAFYINGLCFTIVSQLSHLVSETETPRPRGDRLDVDWSVHQLLASCDFSQRNRVLSWYLGGLNFQVEHHLFPYICHVQYSRVAPIVRNVCRELGLPYNVHVNLLDGLRSHYRYLQRLAQPPQLPATTPRDATPPAPAID
jgi:linoleoyl-CoA desaturase